MIWQATCYLYYWLMLYMQNRTLNITAISVGDEFETYESVKCKIEEIPTYSDRN